MGGRGSSSASSGVFTKGTPVHVERYVSRTSGLYSGSNDIVLEAKDSGGGSIEVNYAQATGYRQQNKKTSYAQYEIKHGFTNQTSTGKTKDLEAVNINLNKVKQIGGKTYGLGSLLKNHGFRWNGTKKVWEK